MVQPYSVFKANHNIIYSLPAICTQKELDENYGKPYDYLSLLFLGIRYTLLKILPSKFVPKRNLWQLSGMFMCTELVTEVITKERDSMITPYKLYLKLTRPYN